MGGGFGELPRPRYKGGRRSHGRDPLTVCYQNVRGLNSKTVDCLSAVSAQDSTLIAFTETWLTESVCDAEMFDGRYLVFRRDRGARGGGVLLAVKSDNIRSAKRLLHFETVGEHLWVRIDLREGSLYVCVLYFPPTLYRVVAGAFFSRLQSLSDELRNKNILIMGDFNLVSAPYLRSEVEFTCNLLNLININCVNNGFNAQLDLLLTNVNCGVVINDFAFVAEDRYHPTLSFDLYLKAFESERVDDDECENWMNGWFYKNVDFNRLNEVLSHMDWTQLYESEDVDSALEVFYNVLYSAFDECFPRRRPFVNISRYPKWFSGETIFLLRKKSLIHKIWKRSRNNNVYEEYRAIRARAKHSIDNSYKSYISECEASILHDPSKFWNFVNSKRSSRSSLSTMQHGDFVFESAESIANGFSQYFQSVFDGARPSDHILSSDTQHAWPPTLMIGELTDADIRFGFTKLKSRPSSGPDFVPDFILKGCKSSLGGVLLHLFNFILQSCKYPVLWKCTKVSPIFKKGDRSSISNYRPVALLSAPAKLLEIIIHKRVYNHCKSFLVDQQHGFLPGRSTVTNLLCFSSFVTKSLDAGEQVDVIYMDFEKAFDKVNHEVLIHKLKSFGFSNSLTTLFADYLRNRRQVVKYGPAYSDEFFCPSGVPQGSNLGPLLFLLFINDIGTAIGHSNFLLYADDLKIYRKVSAVDDCASLQADLDSLWRWASENRLPFSVTKCQVVTFTRSFSPIIASYNIGGNALHRCSSVKDLGVTFQDNWKFTIHIEEVCNKALSRLGFVMRSAGGFNNTLVLRTLYEALVRSVLESGSIIWIPSDEKSILMLERVERKFLRYLYLKVYGYYPFLYPSDFILGALGYYSLSSRRKVYIVKHFWKLLVGVIDNPSVLKQLPFLAPEVGRSSRYRPLLLPLKVRSRVLFDSPLAIAVRLLNIVHRHIDLFCVDYEELVRFLWDGVSDWHI